MLEPEVGLDNKGDVYLEWDFARERQISLRINPVGVVHYAGNNDGIRFHGSFALPEEIGNFLSKHARAAIRADGGL